MIQVEQYGPVIAIRMARRFLGKPLYWTAAYWVDGLLIDTGPAATARELVHVLDQVQVRQIVLTHGHEDHIGGRAALRRRHPDVPVYASLRTIDLVKEPQQLNMQFYRRVVWGVPAAVDNLIALEEVQDTVRTPRYTLRSVETPGHTRDHVSFFEPQQRWVFSGDAFIGGRDHSWAREVDLFSVIGSLQTLAALEPDRLFPGSGNVRRAPVTELLAKVNYLTEIADDVARLEAGGLSPEAIADQLFPSDSNMSFWTQRHFTALNLVHACRNYNGLFLPSDILESYPDSAHSAAADATRPSPKRSTDYGDLIR